MNRDANLTLRSNHPRIIIFVKIVSSLKAFMVLEKKTFKHFLPYVGMAIILFKGVEPFEQIVNNPSIEGPM